MLIKKAVVKIGRELRQYYYRLQDFQSPTYSTTSFQTGELHAYFASVPIDELRPFSAQIAALTEHYIAHRFDLLGSGWVQVKHGMRCSGVEGYRYQSGQAVVADTKGEWLRGRINPANLNEAQRIWRLIASNYVPIDWHMDFKSGYRWSETTWYRHITYGHLPGVDVKVPWELARAQHLPQLAWAYALASAGEPGFNQPEAYLREFRNQVLDFIATNPPRYGVNWTCTMDVAIRAANWLVTYDLFRAYGAAFDTPFVAEFARSIYQHGQHIVASLEWYPGLRSNHYLANIAGLLFVAAYLPRAPQVDVWLAFALQELIQETCDQFNKDGSNFEASTSYHRLSAEMVAYATALALSLPSEKLAALSECDRRLVKFPTPLKLVFSDNAPLFPSEYVVRLEKMAEFTLHISKPSGQVPQIGDNDSGRFLKLFPVYRQLTVRQARSRYVNLNGYDGLPDDATYWDENILDHRHLVAALNGLFGREDLSAFADGPETAILRGVVGGKLQSSYIQAGKLPAAQQVRIGEDWSRLCSSIRPHTNMRRFTIPLTGRGLRDDFRTYGYPDFGLFVFRSRRLHMVVRCGSIGQLGNGGHAHNDQLAIEFSVDGEDWITDPGTYLYTPLPALRNEYRSVKAHFAPQLPGCEPGNLNLGLFQLGNEALARCLYFGSEGFAGMHQGYGSPLYRLITIAEDRIIIEDVIEDDRILRDFGDHLQSRWPLPGELLQSPKYGCQCR